MLLEGEAGVFKQYSYPVLMVCIEAVCVLHDRSVMQPDGSKAVLRRCLPLEFSSKCGKGMRCEGGGGEALQCTCEGGGGQALRCTSHC
jgi:hypothetical protein